MWLARDKSIKTVSGKIIIGDLHLFMNKPKRKIPKGQEWLVKSGMNIEENHWEARGSKMKFPKDIYNDIKWEDEPIEVKLDTVYNRWDLDIFKYLNRIKEITDTYKNPIANDATGSTLCNEISNTINELSKKLVIK